MYDYGNLFFGDSLQFSNVTTFITATVPDPIQQMYQDKQLFRDQVLINWIGPKYNGGTPITSYVVSIFDTVTSSNTSITLSPSLSTYLTNSLVPGRLYQINIKCVNNIGSSFWL